MVDEPKEVAEVSEDVSLDDAIEQHFSGEQETPSDSSTEKQTTSEETEVTEDAGADQLEKSQSEETEAEADEGADPKDLMFRKGYNEAKGKSEKELEELKGKLEKYSDFEAKLEKFDKVTSSPSYVKAQMREEGYTEEAIASKLKEMGHSVEEPTQDDVALVMKELGVDDNSITPELKNTIGDIAKIADIIARDRLNRTVPEKLQSVEERLNQMSQKEGASKLVNAMKSTVEKEGILDYEKDVAPTVNEYVQQNPKATQADVYEYFREMSRNLTIERLRLGKKQANRAESKDQNRQNTDTVPSDGKLETYDEKQPIGDWLDNAMDKLNVRW